MTETVETTRKTLSLSAGATPKIRLPERQGTIIPKRGKGSAGRDVANNEGRTKPKSNPRHFRYDEDDASFPGHSGGTNRHHRRPGK